MILRDVAHRLEQSLPLWQANAEAEPAESLLTHELEIGGGVG